MIAEARREQIRELLMEAGAVTVSELQARFGVSPMTARRDLVALEERGSARRTHGGAVLPSVAAHEHSFSQRMLVAAESKQRLADVAFALLTPGETVFLDSSSTAFVLACRIAESGLGVRVLTNNGPAIQALAASEHELEFSVIGGAHRRLTGSFVGPSAVRMIREHFVDRLFFSVTGLARNGTLTDGDDLEASVKRAMLEQAAEAALLLDATKLQTYGRHAIGPVARASLVVTERDDPRLHADGVTVRVLS